MFKSCPLIFFIGLFFIFSECVSNSTKSSSTPQTSTKSDFVFASYTEKSPATRSFSANTAPASAAPQEPDFKNPLHCYYNITSSYGYRTNPISGNYKMHDGIDLACSRGSSIYASASGKVTTRSYSSIYGNYIIITHSNGCKTMYAHMENFGNYYVSDCVTTDSIIGYVGSTGQSTGPHCHFEIIKNGSSINPSTKIHFM